VLERAIFLSNSNLRIKVTPYRVELFRKQNKVTRKHVMSAYGPLWSVVHGTHYRTSGYPYGDLWAFTSRPHLSTSIPQFGHVQPPHMDC
jgi:hypothetical protein